MASLFEGNTTGNRKKRNRGKNMKTKRIFTALVILLAFCLSACGNNSSKNTAKDTEIPELPELVGTWVCEYDSASESQLVDDEDQLITSFEITQDLTLIVNGKAYKAETYEYYPQSQGSKYRLYFADSDYSVDEPQDYEYMTGKTREGMGLLKGNHGIVFTRSSDIVAFPMPSNLVGVWVFDPTDIGGKGKDKNGLEITSFTITQDGNMEINGENYPYNEAASRSISETGIEKAYFFGNSEYKIVVNEIPEGLIGGENVNPWIFEDRNGNAEDYLQSTGYWHGKQLVDVTTENWQEYFDLKTLLYKAPSNLPGVDEEAYLLCALMPKEGVDIVLGVNFKVTATISDPVYGFIYMNEDRTEVMSTQEYEQKYKKEFESVEMPRTVKATLEKYEKYGGYACELLLMSFVNDTGEDRASAIIDVSTSVDAVSGQILIN